MITTCRKCGGMFRTTEEDACDPAGTDCVACHWKTTEHQAMAVVVDTNGRGGYCHLCELPLNDPIHKPRG